MNHSHRWVDFFTRRKTQHQLAPANSSEGFDLVEIAGDFHQAEFVVHRRRDGMFIAMSRLRGLNYDCDH